MAQVQETTVTITEEAVQENIQQTKDYVDSLGLENIDGVINAVYYVNE